MRKFVWKNWKEWKEFAATAPEKEVRAMILKLVSANAMQSGKISALEFIQKTIQKCLQRTINRLMQVCEQNAVLGGKKGNKVMMEYDVAEEVGKLDHLV